MLALLLLLIALVVFIMRTRRKRQRVVGLLLLLLLLPLWTTLWNCANASSFDLLRYSPKVIVNYMSRSQERAFAENGKFSDSLDLVMLDLPRQSAQFVYTVRAKPDAAFQYATTRADCHFCRVSLTDWFPPFQTGCFSDFCSNPIPCQAQSYAVVVFVTREADKVTLTNVFCQGKEPGTVPLNPTYRDGMVDCGEDAKKLGESGSLPFRV